MKLVEPAIFGHHTTWHDGNVALLTSTGQIVSVAAERVDRRKHSWDSRRAYQFLKERYPREGFGAPSDFFRDSSESLDTDGHYLAHASCVFFTSPFKEAGILVIDGQGPQFGRLACTSLWYGHGDSIDLVEVPYLTNEVFAEHSIGHFYTAIGAMAGMTELHEEGKTMALAAYGAPSGFLDFLRQYATSFSDGSYFIEPEFLYGILGNTLGRAHYGWDVPQGSANAIWREYLSLRGRPIRLRQENVSQQDMDIACAGQLLLEEMVLGLARRLKRLTGCDNICLSGGVALNGCCNARVRNSGLFKQLYVFPASGDDGQALGKLLHFVRAKGLDIDTQATTAFYGPEYTPEEIDSALGQMADHFDVLGQGEQFVIDDAAEMLAEGAIIGRFSGRSEIGPRALGHRSILADPRSARMRERINATVKHREWYRPLAPVVVEEKISEYFDHDGTAPFMLTIEHVLPHRINAIAGAVHVDGSARVQSVNASQDAGLHALLCRFGARTGVFVLLNTSFNGRNEPIVETPLDALRAFVNLRLDALIFENYLLKCGGSTGT